VNTASEAFQFVLDAKFLLLQRRDPHFIPVGIGHFGGDDVVDFLVLVGQVVDLSLQRHAFTSSVRSGVRARGHAAPGPKSKAPSPLPVILKFG
jgi:hypothetical protein